MRAGDTTGEHKGIRMPKSIRGKVKIRPEDKQEPPVLHEPVAYQDDRIRNNRMRRITPAARVFIVQCINTGYSNSQVNTLLRRKQFIMGEEPDVSDDTLLRIRKSDNCLLDIALMTKEIRQIGHNHVGKFIQGWSELGDVVLDRLLGKGDFGDNFEQVSVAECNTVLMNATKVIMDTFAVDLGDRLRKEIEEPEHPSEEADAANKQGKIENLAGYLQATAAAALRRAIREMDIESHKALEAAAAETGVAEETGVANAVYRSEDTQ